MLQGLDLDAVGRWLEDHVDGAVGPFDATLIGGGRSNLTFALTAADGQRFVVRRPPLGHVLATAHDMSREHRIIAALGPTAVPVAPALGLCTDTEVNGAPFYVMGFVDGVVLDSPDKADVLDVPARGKASFDLIDVLADLHAVDVDAVGLGDLARREGYIERQLKRWSTQWANSKTRELPAIDEVAERLAATDPAAARRRRSPTATTGSATAWSIPSSGPSPPSSTGSCARSATRSPTSDTSACTGPTPAAPAAGTTIRQVRRASRRTPSCSTGTRRAPAATSRGIDYYVAFASWRLAVIGEGVYARYLHGAMGDQGIGPAELEAFKTGTEQLAVAAFDAARRLS